MTDDVPLSPQTPADPTCMSPASLPPARGRQGPVSHHLDWLRTLPLRFFIPIVVAEAAGINLLFSLAIGLLTGSPAGIADRDDLPDSHGGLFFLAVVLAPILETLFCQALPIELMRAADRRYRKRFRGPIIVSITLFTIGHLRTDVVTIIGAGIVGGFYLAFTYCHLRTRSVTGAILATAVCHSAFNLIAVLLSLSFGSY